MPKVERYKAKHAFGVMYDGEQITVTAGEIVRAGHPLLKGRKEHFEPVESFGRFDVDVKTREAPGEKRGATAEEKHAEKPKAKEKGKRKRGA